MPIIHQGTGRKDTGRTDKYSDETPLKDYQDYRKDHPADKSARKAKENKDFSFKGPKSTEAKKQALISHIQNLPEFFTNSVEQNLYYDKLEKLIEALK